MKRAILFFLSSIFATGVLAQYPAKPVRLLVPFPAGESVDAAHRLYAALTTKKKTLKIFTAEEGGAEHCQVDNRPLGICYIADWIAANP